MNNQKGVTAIVMILVVFILVAVVALILVNNKAQEEKTVVSGNESAIEMAGEPVSTDTDLETLEMEVDETMIGSPDDDVNGMIEEASTL